MKIKIVSDGTGRGTHILDADTGANLDDMYCSRIEIEAGEIVTATLIIIKPEFDIVVPDVAFEYEAALTYDPDDIDSLDQAIAELQKQRAEKIAH